VVLVVAFPTVGLAQTNNESVDELEEKIDKQNQRIEEINQQIEQYENKLDDTKNQKNTLQNTLTSLNSSISQLKLRVEKTTKQIATTENRISKLNQQIKNTQKDLDTTRQSLKNAIKAIHQANSQSFVESLLGAQSLSAAWKAADQLAQVQVAIQSRIDTIQDLKRKQQAQKRQAQIRRNELRSLEQKLANQQASLRAQKQQKQQLLTQTKQQEREYQNLLAKKREQKRQFEKQLQQFESRLESAVADAEVPGSQVVSFQWPVPEVTITQQFGGTEFAERNPSAYGRAFHNGTDFGASIGTPVTPTKAGTVRSTGNTDTVPGCYSYGKWVLVDHQRLSTLYAHLSSIAVSGGESVDTDSIIGRVGNTGYSTGPHLHLTTYIKDDVRINELESVKDDTNCGQAAIPVAPQAGYLNPMKYLP
jgi:murein DD-endopeptidase MepM/ murein hydrolase activator NlpD